MEKTELQFLINDILYNYREALLDNLPDGCWEEFSLRVEGGSILEGESLEDKYTAQIMTVIEESELTD